VLLRVFISTENSADDRASRFIDGLRDAGLQATCSPLNPLLGHDPRWRDWYASGCKSAIETSDIFVAVETAGYDCSTWMAIEAETAWHATRELGKPRLYHLPRPEGGRPPVGFHGFTGSVVELPVNPDDAVAAVVAAEVTAGSPP
jgi:hypothetical protein